MTSSTKTNSYTSNFTVYAIFCEHFSCVDKQYRLFCYWSFKSSQSLHKMSCRTAALSIAITSFMSRGSRFTFIFYIFLLVKLISCLLSFFTRSWSHLIFCFDWPIFVLNLIFDLHHCTKFFLNKKIRSEILLEINFYLFNFLFLFFFWQILYIFRRFAFLRS